MVGVASSQVAIARPKCPKCFGEEGLVQAEEAWFCAACDNVWHSGPTPRWFPLRYHPTQKALYTTEARIAVCGAGRRSGKTERAMRKGVVEALRNSRYIDFRVAFMAPTRDHAKRIYWETVKALIPEWAVRKVSESELTVYLWNGSLVQVIGMDKPARSEGTPLDFAFYDEAGDHRPETWPMHVQPALDTPGRPGRAWIYGVTRPGGGFRELADRAKDPTVEDMAFFGWPSADIVPASQIELAKARMDPRIFEQEYGGQFVFFEGRIYYQFERQAHVEALEYQPDLPLALAFDFNVNPGTALVIQEQSVGTLPSEQRTREGGFRVADRFTAVLDEVYLSDSNTPAVLREILSPDRPWRGHEGIVRAYGDYTGGARGTAKIAGSDWDIIENVLTRAYPGRFILHNDKRVGSERPRINATNARLRDADDLIHLLVSPRCKELIQDLDEVTAKKGSTTGDIDKSDPKRTHVSDELGYYVDYEFPVGGGEVWEEEELLL